MDEIRQVNSHCRLALLWLHEFVKLNPIQSRREAEKKGTIHLLHALYPGHEPELYYFPNGKPYVKNMSGGISISHSHDLLAIFADEKNTHTGLDVELVRDKVLKIRHKFLSEKEKAFIPEKNVMMHIVAWCVKETMYKIHSEGKVDFIQHLSIEPFSEGDEIIHASCNAGDGQFSKQIKIERVLDYVLAYPVN